MKTMLITGCITAVIFFSACNGGNTGQPAVPAEQKVSEDKNNSNPDYQAGLLLVGQSDCSSCHKVEETLIGPSYRAIADKYPATDEQINRLAQTVIKGVTPETAVWGKLPMAPHPQLLKDDVVKMVKYILLLKK